MSLRQALLPTPNAVATGQTSTFNLDLGKRYHALWLELGDSATVAGTTVAVVLANLVDQIRVKVNGKVQRTMTGVELHAIYGAMGAAFCGKFNGIASLGSGLTTGGRIYLPIWFSEPWRNNNSEVPLTAWNAQAIDSLQLEVDLHTGLSGPICGGFYEYDAPVGGLGAIVKWIRQTFGASGTVQDFNTISKQDFLQSIHLFSTSDGKYVNKVKFTANGNIIRDLLNTLENQTLLAGRNLIPDTSATPRFDLIFDYDDPVNSALNANGLNEMTLHVEYSASASGSMVAIIQRTGAPE
jgi:hypothetical protein